MFDELLDCPNARGQSSNKVVDKFESLGSLAPDTAVIVFSAEVFNCARRYCCPGLVGDLANRQGPLTSLNLEATQACPKTALYIIAILASHYEPCTVRSSHIRRGKLFGKHTCVSAFIKKLQALLGRPRKKLPFFPNSF